MLGRWVRKPVCIVKCIRSAPDRSTIPSDGGGPGGNQGSWAISRCLQAAASGGKVSLATALRRPNRGWAGTGGSIHKGRHGPSKYGISQSACPRYVRKWYVSLLSSSLLRPDARPSTTLSTPPHSPLTRRASKHIFIGKA